MLSLFRKIRFIYRYFFAYCSRHAKFIFSSFISGFFFFFLIFHITPVIKDALYPDNKRIGLVGRYTPETLPVQVQRLISIGLTEVAENGEAQPGLAESWDLTDGGKTYIFHLRNGLIWHDGKSFSASDVNYNIRDVTFTPIDETTLKVSLKESYIPLPVLLSRPLLRSGLIGLGMYKVTALKLKGEIVESLNLTPIEEPQLDKKLQKKGLPLLGLKFYLTEEQARLALKLGEVDILEDINDAGEFKTWPNMEVTHRIDHTRYTAIFYNLNDKLLSDKTMRQALSFAVPSLEFEKATGPISPLSWAYNNKVRQYKFDLDTAKRLLKEDDHESTFSAKLTISTFTPYLALAKRVAESWQKLGFTIDIRIENSVPQNYQILLAAQEIPPDPDQYLFWHSTQKETNITKLSNPKIDKLLEDGRKAQDRGKRLKIYYDFQRYLVDEAPATFLYYPSVYTVTRK